MGGPAAGFFTGWLNLIGLIAVTASVAYGCATFIDLTLSTFSSGWADGYSLTRVFVIFLVVLVAAALLNIFSGHLMAVMNNVSVWWHVIGAAIIVLDPDPRARPAPELQLRLHRALQQLGLRRGLDEQAEYWLLVAAVRAAAHAVHDHRASMRQLTCRRRPLLRRPRLPRASGSRSSTRRSVVGSCCSPSCSPCRTVPTGQPTTQVSVAAGWRTSSPNHSGNNTAALVLVISATGQFFCTMRA